MSFPPDPLPPWFAGGSVNLLAGASGTGKTALIAQWAVAFRDGLTVCGHAPHPLAAVGVLSADRSWAQSSQKWFAAAGWPDIPCYSIQDDLGFDLHRLLEKGVRAMLAIFGNCLDQLALPPQSLLIAEPIADWLGGNLLDYRDCSVACRLIRRLLQHRQLTLIGLAHAAKQLADPKRRYQRLQDRLAGSTAILGYADTQMYLASPEELGVEHYTLHVNPHHAPSETFALEREPETGLFTAPRALKEPRKGSAPFPIQELVTWLAQAPEGRLFGDIMTWAKAYSPDMAESTLRRHLHLLTESGLVEKSGRGVYRAGAKYRPN